ncbi:hypothetical protein LAV_00034 [Sphingobium phage Lacusarx]|uniref:Uncharacterized protein n=1 Tax=Sphingobium phage Lacusarx TaxID=1980139 RepID=A0A1W6DX00_9CAUD|nr:hypothetical protein FDH44_gp034 [Sphingobium phage Lacusarx]ARK07434.1 hypothetical protein LAV_00034 [Sphingobium phage Lacusarx]
MEAVGSLLNSPVQKHDVAGSSNSLGVSRNRDSFGVQLSNAKAIEVARLLIPNTFGKRSELQTVVDYYDRYNNYTKGWKRWNHLNGEYDRRL